jgi:ParB family chromosome partitioning protein
MSTQVVHNSGNNEWYTTDGYMALVREVMGRIDLDPASCEAANDVVQATRYYTAEDDGLQHPWAGRVWMNPPYGSQLIARFASKLVEHWSDGNICEAIVLVNNATETRWYHTLADYATAACFPLGRVRFWQRGLTPLMSPLQGQVFFYYGERPERFAEVFRAIGQLWRPWNR